ncbi:DUF4145 domain-containing protein [Chryseobacterium sp. SL1]|uniref:DUF4145 domain-containing protein n=1 Tax=Chryseobacterium sp. SL1 TaxID=2995159 RepID=UPI0022755810|nr:DUF4145 domain-containing protein [Chryseobacterium sp. SL1]MCY1660126.1 DUF4145 domain-containing protein [Chryseobacterium sp. SL1]
MKTTAKTKIQNLEKEAIEAWHTAMGDRTIGFKLSVSEARIVLERLCQAFHIRKYEKEYDQHLYQLIAFLHSESFVNDQVKTCMNAIRQFGNDRVHKSTAIDKAFTDLIRLNLIEVMKWYQIGSGELFKGIALKKYQDILKGKPVSTYHKLFTKKRISEENLEKNIDNEKLHTQESNVKNLLRNPVFSSLIVDASGSMHPYKGSVIEAHREALSAIRGSMICRQKALFLMQHTFNKESTLLNTLSLVDSKGQDAIISLDNTNYHTTRTTALYDTLYDAITRLCQEADALKTLKGRKPEITIGILTDGEDNESTYKPQDIRNLMQYMEEEKMIRSSVVIGWTGTGGFQESDLEKLRQDIGFKEYISLNLSDPSAIRNAFNLWSQRVI